MDLKDKINFSIWCDFIERDFLENEFKDLLDKNIIYGATSNPSIFENAITTSTAYKQQISMLKDNHEKKVYEELAIADIKLAGTIMQDLHNDISDSGFISIEVDPSLCDDAMATIEEGARLYSTIQCDNVMIKIPATNAGYIAMENLTAMGINVNATLIFSTNQAKEATKALNSGLKKSKRNDTQAVVSIFVSRFDRALDDKLNSLNIAPSKTGILNATKCYYEIEKFNNKNIRTLFASTGVKGDKLPSSYYIDNLIYPHTINTAPLSTIKSFMKNNRFEPSKIPTKQACDEYFKLLEKSSIDIQQISDILLKDGLEAFKQSFINILNNLK